MGIRIKGELTGVRNLFLTPVLNFEGERLQARAGPLYPPSSTLPFPLHNTILKKHCDYEEDLPDSNSSSNGKRIKGELMGVGDLSLTPILNFKGERLQARAGPLYPPPSTSLFLCIDTIFKSTVITENPC